MCSCIIKDVEGVKQVQEIIDVILEVSDEKRYQHMLECIRALLIPNHYRLNLIKVPAKTGRFKAYQDFGQISKGDYKLFLSDKVVAVSNRLVMDFLSVATTNGSAKLLGTYGAVLKLGGDLDEVHEVYGSYCYDDGDSERVISGANPLFFQRVHVVDSNCLFVVGNLPEFDSNLERYRIADLCFSMAADGFDTMAIMQNEPYVKLSALDDFSDKSMEIAGEKEYFQEKHFEQLYPLVDILIPTYNSPKFFEEALKSALNQDYPNIAVHIGDDSTNNDTEEIVRKYQQRYANIVYTHHSAPLGGFGYNNTKFLLNSSSARYINLLYHDDIIYRNRVLAMMAYFFTDVDRKIGMVASVRDCIDENGRITKLESPWLPKDKVTYLSEEHARKILLMQSNFIGEQSTVLVDKQCMQSYKGEYMTGWYCNIREKSMGDVSLFLDILRHKSIVFLNESLSALRRHSGQNACKPEVLINCVIDCLMLIVVSYENRCFIQSEQDLYCFMRQWAEKHTWNMRMLNEYINRGMLSEEYNLKMVVLNGINYLIKDNRFEEALDCFNQYKNVSYVIKV